MVLYKVFYTTYSGGKKLSTHSEITAMRVDGNILFTTSKDLGLRAYQI